MFSFSSALFLTVKNLKSSFLALGEARLKVFGFTASWIDFFYLIALISSLGILGEGESSLLGFFFYISNSLLYAL